MGFEVCLFVIDDVIFDNMQIIGNEDSISSKCAIDIPDICHKQVPILTTTTPSPSQNMECTISDTNFDVILVNKYAMKINMKRDKFLEKGISYKHNKKKLKFFENNPDFYLDSTCFA